jgi:hypothetical protein
MTSKNHESSVSIRWRDAAEDAELIEDDDAEEAAALEAGGER